MTGTWGIPTQMGLTSSLASTPYLHYRWHSLPLPAPPSAAPITHHFFYFSSGVLWEVRTYCEIIVALTF